jgi:hypothetical protein
MPKMYVIPTDSPNAFATGRNPQHASVAVTEGILNLLTDEELEGVPGGQPNWTIDRRPVNSVQTLRAPYFAL